MKELRQKLDCEDFVSEMCDRIVEDTPFQPINLGLFDELNVNRVVIKDVVWQALLARVEMKSSPGYPYMLEYPNNAKLFGYKAGIKVSQSFEAEIKSMVEERIRRMLILGEVEEEMGEFELIGIELVAHGLCDYSRVFQKKEMTKRTKIGRGINSVSIVDQFIDRLLFTEQAEKEVENWKDNDCAAGIDIKNLHDTGFLFEKLNEISRALSTAMESNDIQGYDEAWNLICWQLLKAWGRAYWKKSGSPRWWMILFSARILCLQNPLFVLSDGTVIVKKYPHWLSGFFGTLVFGSKVRNMLARIKYVLGRGLTKGQADAIFNAIIKISEAMGDDCVEPKAGDSVEIYRSLGFVITDRFESLDPKENDLDLNEYHFCSQVITKYIAYPEAYTKSLGTLLMHSELDYDLIDGFLYEMRYRPDFVVIRDELLDLLEEYYPIDVNCLRIAWSNWNFPTIE